MRDALPRPDVGRDVVDARTLQHQPHAQVEQAVLQSVPVAVRLAVEVVDAIRSQGHDMI